MIGTRQRQLQCMFELDQVLQHIFKADFDFELALKNFVSIEFGKAIVSLNLDTKNASSLRKQLQELLDTIGHMSIIEIQVGFEPTEETLEKIVGWVKKQVAPECLVEVIHKQSIIGGATISYQGKYTDISLKTKLLKTFQTEEMWIRTYFNL